MAVNTEADFKMMTWKQATLYYIHHIDAETDTFHKTASAFRVGFLTLATRFAPLTAGVGVLNDTLLWVPLANGVFAADNFISYPALLFVIFSGTRIASIRRKKNRQIKKALFSDD